MFLIGENRTGQNVFDDVLANDSLGGASLDLFFARLGSDSLDQAILEVVGKL